MPPSDAHREGMKKLQKGREKEKREVDEQSNTLPTKFTLIKLVGTKPRNCFDNTHPRELCVLKSLLRYGIEITN